MTVSKLTAPLVAQAARLTGALFLHENWSQQDLHAAITDENRAFFVATVQGCLAGCAGLQQVGEQGDVLTVGVDPAYRRQGIGAALLDALVQEFKDRGGRELFLEVRAGNVPARALYEQKGFVAISQRKNYYRAPVEDAIIYRYEVQL